ncbi:MAG TPA: sigma 54-interacting transcriptional regulator [Thermoanaerobaculia bacterium]|nr:sigma 54-interacting transcriptional regulator [Thermoanaerobaculia bacterium]
MHSSFLGDGRAMAELRRVGARLADFPYPLLITGETGVGKFELALWIHENSRRVSQRFVDVHCANLTDTLFESMLFGHERGAFTDARERHEGRVETAGRGTLLFDEIDCLDLRAQAKLLRFVDRRTFERVGGRETHRSPASLIFTTNQDLWQMVEDGAFRADLLARVTWAVLRIPPLRDHPEDITFLAGRFLEEARVQFGIRALRWSADALHLLQEYSWPGNVRELKSIVYVAAYLNRDDSIIEASALTILLNARPQAITAIARGELSLAGARGDVERDVIAEALRRTDGNRVHAARLLNIGRRTLQGKITKYGL